jgi:hypothetical protein
VSVGLRVRGPRKTDTSGTSAFYTHPSEMSREN